MNRDIQIAIGSLLVGGGIGYIFATHRLEAKYESMLEAELAKTREHYTKVNVPTQPFSSPAEAVEALVIATDKTDRDVAEELVEPYISPKPVAYQNIFDKTSGGEDSSSDDEFDYESEVEKRDPDRPYVITVDEFMTGELDYTQVTLTFFERDEVLIDEREDRIDDKDAMVGEENLLRFGHGSKDPNVVYIRNDVRKVDVEVCRSGGSYTHEVLGFDDEEKPRRPRKFRDADE